MNIDRFKHLWKIFSHINRTKEYGHIFKHGASVDSMLGYINGYVGRTGCGCGPISKQEIRDVLNLRLDALDRLAIRKHEILCELERL